MGLKLKSPLSARLNPMVSLSELTADYYRLRAETERALALNAGDPLEWEQRLAKAAELEALCLGVLPSTPEDAPLEPSGPLDPDENFFSTARAA